ncbi:MAG: VWA-like domain-containing protein [Lachnospiraceae bacterium]|nr:VWA-like domain-containing protein [Lachnospiraceae bacterium]
MNRISRQEGLCLQVLQNCRNELCDLFPGLDIAFAILQYRSHSEPGFATDGESFLYFPPDLLRLYAENPTCLRRGYLHVLLHCLYRHWLCPADRDLEIWNLACDMAVEQIIEAEGIPELGFSEPLVTKCLHLLGNFPLAAETIAQRLEEGRFPYSLEEMREAFFFDNHACWMRKPAPAMQKRWEKALLRIAGQSRKGSGGRRGVNPGIMEEEVPPAKSSRTDYRRILRRFMVPREEIELDEDSFDYIYYHLGMEQYGSMPLIEPLEYKEVYRLEELVIAIDTSGSCSGEAVGRFLDETWELLAGQENFFRKMNVFFIQCDCEVRDVALIRSREEWKKYRERIQIRGRGGTDFRPVFREVSRLREEKKLKRMRALIYFTDGDGLYPLTPPDFETIFILLKEKCRPDLVPDWAMKLKI